MDTYIQNEIKQVIYINKNHNTLLNQFNFNIMKALNFREGNFIHLILEAILFRKYIIGTEPTKDIKIQGKMLIFMPENSANESYASDLTHGFFDSYNTPPWWTWINFTLEHGVPHLLAWICDEYVDMVNYAIEQTAHEESIIWMPNDYSTIVHHSSIRYDFSKKHSK